ncbi:MAG: site-specific integrase [Calditrichaeota bacterium]|nr:MAG: site-specific integrase [Calditrichota bacterium]
MYNGYLPTLKLFLKYLEKKDYPVQKGMADIIKLPEPSYRRLTPLTEEEQRQLREFLLFHVNSELQRRDAALAFLIWSTGCSINEAIALNVHEEGIIKTDGSEIESGDFEMKDGELYVTLGNILDGERQVKVPEETLAFLNFYLENRGFISPILFARLTNTQNIKRLSEKSAKKSIERVFKKAGIGAPEGRADEVLQLTARYRLGNASARSEFNSASILEMKIASEQPTGEMLNEFQMGSHVA